MGFLEWLLREPYDKYALFARDQIELIRRDVVRQYGDSTGPNACKVGEACKVRIISINEQGGVESHKYALALWQISKALHPNIVTDADRPTLIKEVWKDLDI